MYYLAYSNSSNNLINLSETEIQQESGITVEYRDGDIPDLGLWIWNPSILEWEARPSKRTMNRIDFMRKFTETELATIYTAAKSSVMVEVWLDKFRQVEYINLDDPETIRGLNALESAAIIGVGRASEILA